MLRHFPKYDAAALDWTNLLQGTSDDVERVERYVLDRVESEPVLMEVDRRAAVAASRAEVLQFLKPHLGNRDIRIASRDFGSLVVIASAGVAATLRQPTTRGSPSVCECPANAGQVESAGGDTERDDA